MTNGSSKRKRISRPVTNPCRKEARYTIFRDALLILDMAAAHIIMELNREVSKYSKGKNMLQRIAIIGEDHRLPAVRATRHPPAA
jgi:hypothetical protein